MTAYRRHYVEGGTYFFTVVTFDRLPLLTKPENRQLLHSAWSDVQERFPFETIAVCLLPDHLHTIWKLPEGDADYSSRWKKIKSLFTDRYLSNIGSGEPRSKSHRSSGEAAIWQRRFWEHWIRDEVDLQNHIQYIHYNPVKHGLVRKVSEWPWSSFQRFAAMGIYDKDWGSADLQNLANLDVKE